MADISTEIKKIEEASRGEEVRDAIVDSLNKINEDRNGFENSVSEVQEGLEETNSALDSVKKTADAAAVKTDVEDALKKKQDLLTFDDTPTDGSDNPVKSAGILKAIQEAIGSGGNNTDTTYSMSLSGNVLTLTPSSGDAQSVTLPSAGESTEDTNTTYVLAIDGNILSLTPSDGGAAQKVTLPGGTDTNTTYVFAISGNDLVITPSDGDPVTLTLPSGSGSSGSDSGTSVNADWSVTDEATEGFIKNKPAVAVGTGTSAVLEGKAKESSGNYSHAEGNGTTASGGSSHAEGSNSKATLSYAHAEGQSTTASGSSSHSEGMSTTAKGDQSHAEGYSTTAGGKYAHVEGNTVTASGTGAHAEGQHTTASGSYQHVFGKYNVEDKSSVYAEIVGNGSSTAASNARTLDWKGNEVIAGKMTVGSGPEVDLDVATKKYVDDLIASLQENVDELAQKVNGTVS